MNLSDVAYRRAATISSLDKADASARLESVGIRVGAVIEVLGRTASRGYLVRVDDTRVVLGCDLAALINCSYSRSE